MVAVLMNLIDTDAMEEISEAEEVLDSAGARNPSERMLLMQKIFAFGRTGGRRETIAFSRVPAMGEYVTVPMEEDVWYRVDFVLHTPGHPAHVAEIWAVEQEEVG
jgi:hypothetical protein